MENISAQYLINQFNSGHISPEEETLLEQFIENGTIQLEELTELNKLHEKVGIYFSEQLSKEMRENFSTFLQEAKNKKSSSWWPNFPFRWPALHPGFQLAFATMCLVIGMAIGNFWKEGSPEPTTEIAQKIDQMQDMQQLLMSALLEKESATERLKVVNHTKTMKDVDDQVTDALLYTLNYDESTSVRLAALESLYQYVEKPNVREGLVKSITNQESPMVQIALAEVMVAIEEKRAVEPFETLLKRESVPQEVKNSIQQRMAILL